MVRDLLVSVAYRYPAGSLLTMPVKTITFALRPFQGAGDVLKTSPDLMILDGQQRLTSLYQALYSDKGINYKGRIFHFYVNVKVLMSDTDGIDIGDPFFEKALFFVSVERNGKLVRYDGLTPLYELTTYDQELSAGSLPLCLTFNPDRLSKWKDDYLLRQASDLDGYRALNHQWEASVKPWLDRIRNYTFPAVELRPDMPLNAICHIFEKVNSTGVPLDVFDLCTAILWAQGFALNQKWAETKQVLQPQMRMQPLSGTYFLQGIVLLDALNRKRSDPKVSVLCRKQDLMALKRPMVERWWPVLIEGCREAAKFMTDEGILSERILPYSTLIMPLAAIFADLKQRKNPVAMGAAWIKVRQWYWCSVFSQRYGSQVETLGAQDFEQVINWIDGGSPPDVVRTFYFRSDLLQEVTSLRNAIYKGVLCLLAQNGAKDFGGGGKLSTDLFHNTRQDHHHIFPKAALKKLGITDPRLDTILNKTLINAAVNKSIGGRLPSQYIQTLSNQLTPTIIDDILHTHLVSPDKLNSDNWEIFMRDRRERLRQLIESACGGVVQPFADGELIVEEIEEEEVVV